MSHFIGLIVLTIAVVVALVGFIALLITVAAILTDALR